MNRLVFFLIFVLLSACGTTAPAEPAAPPTEGLAEGASPTAEPPAAESPAPTSPTEAPPAEAPPEAPGDGSAVALPPPSTFDALPGWVAEVAALLGPDGDASGAVAALAAAGFGSEATDWSRADLTGDGVAEWIVRVRDRADPEGPPWGPPGNLFVARSALPAEILYLGSFDDPYAAPTLLSTGDLTGDGVGDLVYEFTVCGANTCWQYYRVASWHGGAGLRELLVSDVEPAILGYGMTYSEPTVEDRTGDGVLDLVLYGGTAGSVGAGPQRARTELWAFDGSMMALAQSAFDPSPLRYFRLLDANAAFDAGDYAAAATLYTEARDDEALESHGFDFAGSAMDERDAIRQYAAFRLVLTALLEGNPTLATERLGWLESTYPATPISAGAALLLASGSDLPAACATVRASFAEGADVTGPLVYMGYTNPELTAATLCPIE